MPAYLAQFRLIVHFATTSAKQLLIPPYTYNDGLTLLRDKLRDHRQYAAVLRASAAGEHTL